MKKNYIQPQLFISGLQIDVILHRASEGIIRSNTVDYSGADESMGIDNSGGSVTMSSKGRGGFYEGY